MATGMNGRCLLNPTATSVKNAFVFMQHFVITCNNCMYVTVSKVKSSHNATMAFVSYAYKLVMVSYNVYALYVDNSSKNWIACLCFQY